MALEQATFDVFINILNKNAFKGIENEAKKAYDNVNNTAKKTHNNVNKFANESSKSYSNLGRTIVGAFGGLSAGLILKDAISTFSTFEKEMSNVKALTQATDSQFAELKSQAEQLGKSTAFTAKQAAEGMGFLAMAGLDNTKIMEAMPGVLDLAAAGSIDLAQAADIASNVLTQFGLSASEMNRVNDVLASTSTKSNTNIQQLAEGLKYAGTTAKILNIPLEETNAVLGVLANAGLQGSMGGTSLNTALLEMSRTSSGAVKELNKLGVITHNSQGKFVGLTNILKQFEQQNISSTQVLDIFGARGGRAMGTLIEAGSEAVISLTTLNEQANGLSKNIAETKLDNLQGDVVKLQSAYQGLVITLQKELGGSMRKVIQNVTTLVQKIEQNADTVKKFAKILGNLLLVFGTYKTLMFGVSQAMKIAKTAQIAYTFSTVALTKGLKAAETATKSFNAATKVSPIGLVMGAISLLIPVIVKLINKNKEATKQQNAFNEQLAETKKLSDEISKTEITFENRDLLTNSQKEDLLETLKLQRKQAEQQLSNAKIDIRRSDAYKDYTKNLENFNKAMLSGNEMQAAAISSDIAKYKRHGLDNFLQEKYGLTSKQMLKQVSDLNKQIIDLQLEGVGASNATSTTTALVTAEPSKDLNELTTQMSTERNIKTVNLTINEMVGVENLNTTNLQESSQKVAELMLMELNKAAATFAVKN